MNKLLQYFQNILIAIDELGNTLLLGSPHETISARVGRNYPNTIYAKIIDTLFFWNSDHCEDSKENEPKSYEKEAIIK